MRDRASASGDRLTAAAGPAKLCISEKVQRLGFLRVPDHRHGQPAAGPGDAPARGRRSFGRRGDGTRRRCVKERWRPIARLPWYIILNTPHDIDALWQKIEHPDLMLIKPDQLRRQASPADRAARRDGMPRWLVESVQVRGQVDEDFAKLTVELLIVVKGAEPVWAPIRLDGQSLTGAREGARPGFATGRNGAMAGQAGR